MTNVYLVGAGCGDAGLITVKGKNAIEKADVLIYDYLANPELLSYARPEAELIYVGKQAGNHVMKQQDINQLIVDKARANRTVTRLKGGDPYVFGRGGEEAEELRKAGIRFEVIPGITSAIGGLAYAGIPITHRGVATSFHVITGHRKDEGSLDYSLYAKLSGTLVFLMGMSHLGDITSSLMQEGKAADTPVAVIHRASTPMQKTVVGTLQSIESEVRKAKLTPPGLIVVGEVIRKRENLNFFEEKPLFGKSVVITRSRNQSSSMVAAVRDLGANPLEAPLIEIEKINQEKLNQELARLDGYSHILFSSENAVQVFFEALYELGMDARALGTSRVAAVGKGTGNRLQEYGIKADLIPKTYVGEELMRLLMPELGENSRVLLPRSADARPFLMQEISKISEVMEVQTYQTRRIDPGKRLGEALSAGTIDYITFACGSAVRNLIACISEEQKVALKEVKLISIGPITSKTMQDCGLTVYKEAEEQTIQGMLEVMTHDC
jgi:uroporphyrinogen III methyltransferase/synthase